MSESAEMCSRSPDDRAGLSWWGHEPADEGQLITDQINVDPEEVARLRAARKSAREGRLVARIALPGEVDETCCCGDPDCTDFEDQVSAWNIPLDEIVTETYVITLEEDGDGTP